MAIPAEHRGRCIFHMTNIENLESILQHGLLSTNEKENLGIEHSSIANENIQRRRSTMEVPCEPFGSVHDYVPFYFCSREPMLLSVINRKNIDQQFIIYLAVKIEILDHADVVFTNASANTASPPEFYNDPTELSNLKWDLVDSPKWSFSLDSDRHGKMAEALIYKSVSIDDIDFIAVWNDHFKDIVVEILEKANLDIEVKVQPYTLNINGERKYMNHYFTKYPIDTTRSLITGPYFLNQRTEKTIEKINENRDNGIPNPQFSFYFSFLKGIC